MHTLLDLRGSIPTFLDITHGRSNDVAILDRLAFEAGAFYVMDRGYLHFQRLFRLSQAGAYFVTRAEKNTQYRRQYSRSVDAQTGLRADQTIRLTGQTTQHTYPLALRCVRYYDVSTDKRFTFLTNNFLLPALTIAQLYQSRWTGRSLIIAPKWEFPIRNNNQAPSLFLAALEEYTRRLSRRRH